jgi:alpha-tubulin suppressor-like RCC1 family protein
MNYQWRKDGIDIAGATGPTYSVGHARPNQAGRYTVVVSNPKGSVTSAPSVLTVNPVAQGAVVEWGCYGGHAPVPIGAQSGIVAISGGGGFDFGNSYVALKNDGSVLTWGPHPGGLLDSVPSMVQSGVTAIAAGGAHILALKSDGSVVAWGQMDFGETKVPASAQNGVRAIAAGFNHSVALKDDGSVVAWGANQFGEINVPADLTGVRAIATGYAHTVALKSDGTVVAWGNNQFGVTDVPVAAQSGVMAIAAGAYNTMALKNDGTVVAWGANDFGQATGTATTTEPYSATASPVTLRGQVLSGVTAIAVGRDHSAALKSDGSVVLWGYSGKGQALGSSTVASPDCATTDPVMFGGEVLSGVTAIAALDGDTLALVGPHVALQARSSGDHLVLSWPSSAIGFTLQSTPRLTPPVTWIDLPNLSAVVGEQFTVTNSSSGGPRFYRLRKP